MVRAVMIVEMAGRPGNHVKEMLGTHTGVLDKLSFVDVHSNKISEPKEIESPGDENMYTCFSEIDFEVDNFSKLSELMFDFMPSSIEVIEPTKVDMDVVEATGLLNNISGRMHRYDEVARLAQAKVHQLNAALETSRNLPSKGEGNNILTEKEVEKMVKKAAKKKATKKKAVKKKAVKKKAVKKKVVKRKVSKKKVTKKKATKKKAKKKR